jgi:nitrate reductase NapD
MNISGIFVHAKPEQLAEVKSDILELPGTEIPVAHEDGRVVVIIDEPEDVPSGKALMEIQNVPGVLSASLVYQHIEEEEGERQEVK